MDFDIKKIIEQVVKKIKSNDDLMATFKQDPVKAIKNAIGIDLSDDQLDTIVTAVKAKLSGDKGNELLNKLGGLLGKKN